MKNYRISSWVIRKNISDQEEVWLHGYTGAVDIVDKVEIANPSLDVHGLMVEKGYLTSFSKEQEEGHFLSLVDQVNSIKKGGNIYVLQLTIDCNFACTYCFENNARRDNRFLASKIGADYFDNIEEVISSIRNDGQEKIILFGGEPLLDGNIQAIKRALALRDKLCIAEFEVITNGYNVDLFADLLSDTDIVFQITLDGTKDTHEKRRIKKRTRSSFDKIVQNISLLIARGQRVELRVNVDQHNHKDIAPLFEKFIELGFHEYPTFSPYLAYTLDYDNFEDGMSPKDLYVYFCQQRSMRQFDIGLDPLGLEKMLQASIVKSAPFSFTSTHCGANKGSMIVFAPDGRLHACWDCGPNDEEIGRYYPIVSWNEASYNKNWLSRKLTNLPVCNKCKYALFCGGGCQYLAEKRTGDFFSPYCNGFQDLFDEVLLRTSISAASE